MGKIPESQRRQIVSVSVGVAGADRSGQIIGGAAGKLAASIAKKEAQDRDLYSDIQANKDIMDVNLSLQNVASQLRVEWAADPSKYPEKFLEEGQRVVSNAAESIQDDDVRSKFITGANTLLRAGVSQAPLWTKAKQKDNATIAAKGAIKTGTLAVGNALNVEQLKHNIATVEEMARTEFPPDVLDPIEIKKFLDDNMSGVIDTYFINKIRQNPELIMQEIKDGDYNDVKHFTKEKGDKFIKQAETRLNAIRSENRRRQDENFGVFTIDFLRGNLNTSSVDAKWENRNTDVANSINDDQRASLMKGYIKRVDREAGVVKAAAPKSRSFIDLVYNVFDDRIEQAKVLEKVIDVWSDNFVSPDELEFLTNFKVKALQYKEATGTGGWLGGAKILTAKTKRFFSGTRAESEEVNALNLLVKNAMLGMGPEAATKNVVDKMDKVKVLEDDPSLITTENPVEASYLKTATAYLKSKGRATDKKSVENVAKQIRLGENK